MTKKLRKTLIVVTSYITVTLHFKDKMSLQHNKYELA
jgi:hypothetical protein